MGHSRPLRHNNESVRRYRAEVSTARVDIAAKLPAPPMGGADAGWALFLDVDGTLLDFARHPDDVEVEPGLLDDLERIRTKLGSALALLSGRPLADLDALFGWDRFAAAGLHGAELRMPDGSMHVAGDATTFAAVRAQAAARIAETPHVLLEDKHRALALHYRHAPEARTAAEAIADELTQQAGDRYVLQHGNHVIELKPAGVDKGRALATLMQATPFRGRTPWMLGDDLTDEDAFTSVNEAGGVSVVVGNRRPTDAHYALDDPATVRAWLHRLAGSDIC
jgi:trehalose 6-phosphate phosphatase